MPNAKQCRLNGGNSVGKSGEWTYPQELRNFIVSQLMAASPASLPFEIIFRGISCLRRDYSGDDVISAIRQLVQAGDVIKISECGFCSRYKLADCRPFGNFANGE
ncbi:MAG: hypothetical protein LBT64_00090 [Puniceicoccales bacterium]|jgi:hypothetical protein|nr:hypothetical protein [Puniceicoccales bacterium]